MNNKYYTYLMFDPFTRLIKIGKSIDPDKRHKTLRTANPSIELIFVTKQFTENELHKKYDSKKMAYEWFSLSKDDLIFISNGDSKIIPKRMCYKNTKKDKQVKEYIKRSNDIIVNYNLIYRFKDYHYLQVTKDGDIFNIKTGNKKKMCVNGSSIGIWITPKKFILKRKLNSYLELIPKFEYVKDDLLTNFGLISKNF